MKRNDLLMPVARPRAFDGGNEGWKMDGDNPVFQDGNPVWVNSDGSETVLKRDTISNLRGEAKTWRNRAEDNLTKLKDFEGIDARAARDALEKLGKIDAKMLIDSGEVDKVRNAVKSEYDAQINERDTRIGTMQARIDGMILDSAFSGSEFIRDNIAVPVEMFRSHFGQFFKVKDDKIEAYDRAGNRIMSKKNMGEYADFNESVELLVEGYSQKDSILKAPDQGGSGNTGAGGSRGTGRVVRRSDLAGMSPGKMAEIMAAVRKGEINLVD